MDYSKYENYFQSLRKYGVLSRFGKAFKTENHYYFFDTGTGKVLECTEPEFIIFKQLSEKNALDINELELTSEQIQVALENIMIAIKTENIFKLPLIKNFDGAHMQELEHVVPQNMEQIILEVTENCNLRCDYCIYNNANDAFRNFSHQEMTTEIALKAIDYILKTSFKDELYIGFYGGEPLLKFDLIKECVDFVLKNKKNKKITFSLTTNGVLMTKDKAKYFASIPDFSLTFSIDGDEEIHNEHRIMKNGTGSFGSSFQGYKNALEVYDLGKQYLITINTVVSPPYSTEKFDRIQNFFETYAHSMQVNCTYVDHPSNKILVQDFFEEKKVENRMPLLSWEKKKLPLEKVKSFTKASQTGSFLKIHKRPIFNTPITQHKFNGCCLPGTRRLYVTTNGKYLPCERVGDIPTIGDVEHGIDIKAIQKYFVDEYVKNSISDCNNCWASLVCSVCYANCYNEEGIDINKKRKACAEERYSLEQNLIYYHETLENDPKSLEILNDMIIV